MADDLGGAVAHRGDEGAPLRQVGPQPAGAALPLAVGAAAGMDQLDLQLGLLDEEGPAQLALPPISQPQQDQLCRRIGC